MTRAGWIITTCFAALLVGLSALFKPAPKLIWNNSASVPIGLYAVHPVADFHLGDLVLVRPPDAIARFLAERGYLAMGVPMLKHVLALPGQSICRFGRTVTVEGMAVGDALDRDHAGRSLPAWWGCRFVADGQVFLMNRRAASSFDGRYFGPLPASTVIGRATPLWIAKED